MSSFRTGGWGHHLCRHEKTGAKEVPLDARFVADSRTVAGHGERPASLRYDARHVAVRRNDMCGICGVWSPDGRLACNEATLTCMRETLRHRGPDDGGTLVRQGVGLGHRRLSIVDLSAAGHQPMPNEDRSVWIAYNGEVYNHLALRRELEAKGHVYRSRTDTETIVHLWEEEGPRCVERLEGMFALAIWDARRGELFLARDRLGVKPLYYARVNDGLLFASEPKALLAHSAVRAELDEDALLDYLTFAFVPPPRTMFAGISKLAPAERMVVGADGSLECERWWSPLCPDTAAEVREMSEEDLVARLRALLRDSVGKRMMSDVPFGVFLSGGLDSSANVALMADLMDSPVRTYSTAPHGHPRYDELGYARLVAGRFSTEHHEVLVDEADMRDALALIAEHEDEPLADWTAIPQHFVSRLARETGTVVIQCGEGADELLHGYDGYAFHRRFAVPFQRLPAPLRRRLGSASARATRRVGRGIRHGEALYDAGHSSLPYWGGALCFRGEVLRRLVNRSRAGDPYAVAERHWSEAALAGADLMQRMTYLELRQRLPELLLARFDRISMASSVEGREPFLDHHLVEFALALPPRLKHRRGTGKWALRAAMRDLLPDAVIDRRKQGFGTPMEEWLRGPFGSWVEMRVRASSLRERGLLDYGLIDELFAAHRSGHGDWSKHLWNLYVLSAWHDRWVAGRAAPV
jgi:asparagine synthase (glutamine-hydrolysing)